MFLGMLSNVKEKGLPFIKDELVNVVDVERKRIISDINDLVSMSFRIDERQADMSYPSWKKYPYHKRSQARRAVFVGDRRLHGGDRRQKGRRIPPRAGVDAVRQARTVSENRRDFSSRQRRK